MDGQSADGQSADGQSADGQSADGQSADAITRKGQSAERESADIQFKKRVILKTVKTSLEKSNTFSLKRKITLKVTLFV